MKTTKSIAFCLLFAVAFSPACEHLLDPHDLPPPDCEIGDPFWLWYGQTAACDDWNITFNGEISDSRCPTSVTCVWEGRVDIQLQVGDELITLGLPDDETLGRSKIVLGDKEIELLEVNPYPVSTNPIPKENYRAKLVVRDL